jgi:hypothetical protein
MEPNTDTLLKKLRVGDRFALYKSHMLFRWVKKLDKTGIWQVMATEDLKGMVAFNQVSEVTKKPLQKKDTLRKGTMHVKFIRHTKAVPGEWIFMGDLVAGDVFKRKQNDVHNWVVVQQRKQFYDVKRTDSAKPSKAGIYAKVLFVKHQKR